MSPEMYTIIGMGIAILAFLWALHRDLRNLGERVARLEGSFESLRDVVVGRRPSPPSGAD